MNSITHVGMDVHKRAITIAMLVPYQTEPLKWQITHTTAAVRRLIHKLKTRAPVSCTYEAGPTGYALQRQLETAGIPCLVAAPSLIPLRHGNRIKTDHRDASKLAELLRAGLLTAVHAPSEDEETHQDRVYRVTSRGIRRISCGRPGRAGRRSLGKHPIRRR